MSEPAKVAACKHRWDKVFPDRCSRCWGTRVRRVRDEFDGEWFHETELAQAPVTEGGWYQGEQGWLTTALIAEAQHRWWQRGDATGVRYADHPEQIEWQCGGCKFFAATGADWGICWHAESEQDGRMVFEHNGCPQHSGIPHAGGEA